MKYILDDKEFYSVKELAIYAGINEKTITARLRRGMSVADACVKKILDANILITKITRKNL
jgi:hypothetical protein